jgi:hypothetical protein
VYGLINYELENLNLFKCDAAVIDVTSNTSMDLGVSETAVINPKDAALTQLLEP